jgi:hypothetical protein
LPTAAQLAADCDTKVTIFLFIVYFFHILWLNTCLFDLYLAFGCFFLVVHLSFIWFHLDNWSLRYRFNCWCQKTHSFWHW